jgi:hypothetical protein
MSNKRDFKLKSVRKDNQGLFILIKGTIHQEEITFLHIHVHPTTLEKNTTRFKNTVDFLYKK